MLSNRLRGSWDRVLGFNRELLGELIGNERQFSAGLRQRLIGRLEAAGDLDRDEAERQVDGTAS